MKLRHCLCLGLLLITSAVRAAQTQPNIVILFADDLGYGDLGSYGHPYNRTPNIDRMAGEGQRWTDFYVPAPVCSPSRGALLTGRLPPRTGLYGEHIAVMFPNDDGGIPSAEITLAERLQSNGYRTAIVGKWHLGDAPEHYPTRNGFDYWYGVPYSNDMDWVGSLTFDEVLAMRAAGRDAEIAAAYAGRMDKYLEPKAEYWETPLIRSERTANGFDDKTYEAPADQSLLTQRYTEESVAIIEADSDAPLFLYVPYTMPHTPLFRSESFAGKSQGGMYGDVIEEIDWSVGQIRAALERAGKAENTLVVFTSDNGPWLYMQHHGGTAGLLNNGKGTTFEGGMRVPAVFWWPDKVVPGTVSGIGSTLDLYATVAALAGIDAAPDAGPEDSLDLSPTLLSRANSPRTTMPFYRGRELQAWRSGPWKLQLVAQGNYRMAPERTVHEVPVLFNLNEDPGEKRDVAWQYPAVVERLLKEIAAHQDSFETRPALFDRRLQANSGT